MATEPVCHIKKKYLTWARPGEMMRMALAIVREAGA